MVKRGVIVCICALMSCMISMHGVEAANASPETELVMKKVQKLLDQKAGFGNASYVRTVYAQLQEKQGDETLHPYAKHMLRRMTDTIEERYTFITSQSALARTKQVIENGVAVKRNQIAIVPKKEVEEEIKIEKEHTVAELPDRIQRITTQPEEEDKVNSQEIFQVAVANEQSAEQDDWYSLGNGRINISQLKRTRISWVNDFRKEEGVNKQIVHQPLLDKTAAEHSYYQRSIGEWTHRRTPHSAFYDYDEITRWFADRGVDFVNDGGATHTENVGLSTLYCDGGDCTDEATTSLSRVFDYFINEKGTNYTAHYDTIVHNKFGQMGFGIAIDESTDTIYSTMHYATEAIRKPVQLTSR